MTDEIERLRGAYESADYTVASVGENRGRADIHLQTDDPSGERLRTIAEEALGDALLGVDVSVEEVGDELGTVVSVRHR